MEKSSEKQIFYFVKNDIIHCIKSIEDDNGQVVFSGNKLYKGFKKNCVKTESNELINFNQYEKSFIDKHFIITSRKKLITDLKSQRKIYYINGIKTIKHY